MDVPGRLTMGKLYNEGGLAPDLMSAKTTQDRCQTELMCYHRMHQRCMLNQDFLNPNCQDCGGCNSLYAVCHRKKYATTQNCVINSPVKSNQTKPRTMYGGYFSVEFARDVEIQTPEYETTQENVALFLHQQYNSDPWLLEQFGGRPICVVSAGNHDMAIPGITQDKFLRNVGWYVNLLLQPCGHIVWLQNTAPNQKDVVVDPNTTSYPQTQKRMLEQNKAVHQLLNTSRHLPLDRITVLDIFEASREWPHGDNVHLNFPWYAALGAFFKQVAERIRTSESPEVVASANQAAASTTDIVHEYTLSGAEEGHADEAFDVEKPMDDSNKDGVEQSPEAAVHGFKK